MVQGKKEIISPLIWYNSPVTWIDRLTALAPVLVILVSFSCTKPEPRSEDKLKILTTIAPLYCFTINVTGDAARVENLLPSGVGPHEYSLSPAAAKKIAESRVVIINGVSLEKWLDKALGVSGYNASGSGKMVVDTSKGIPVIDGDPHIWLSPKNAMIQVQNIRDALIEMDPDSGTTYDRNAALYLKKLEALDREIRDEVKGWTDREFVSLLPAFQYLAREYGLVQAAVIQEVPEVEPSPKHIADVMEIMKSKKIPAVFTEPVISHKIVNAIAHDLNLEVYSLDALETGPGRSDPEWYVNAMKTNLDMLRKVLDRRH